MSIFTVNPISFSAEPGAHERRLKRVFANALFADSGIQVTPQTVEDAQLQDRLEAEKFLEEFHALVEKVVGMDARVESDIMLDLKQQLDKSYETASGLGGDMSDIKAAIKELVGLMMKAIRTGAGDDQQALLNLAEEELAREMHFELLDYPLVVDLLRPDGLIEKDILVPTLLSEELDAIPAVASIFTPEQMTELVAEAKALIEKKEVEDCDVSAAKTNLNIMERAAAATN